MRTTHTTKEFEALGMSPDQAVACWFDCFNRDQLNTLNTAMNDGLAIVRAPRTPKRVRDTVDVLRDSAWSHRVILRNAIASACAPWFEVRQ